MCNEEVLEVIERFNITIEEYQARKIADFADIFKTSDEFESYGANWVMADDGAVLYFDGDDGQMIFSYAEMFNDGVSVRLHDCNYCDIQPETMIEIRDEILAFVESADEIEEKDICCVGA